MEKFYKYYFSILLFTLRKSKPILNYLGINWPHILIAVLLSIFTTIIVNTRTDSVCEIFMMINKVFCPFSIIIFPILIFLCIKSRHEINQNLNISNHRELIIDIPELCTTISQSCSPYLYMFLFNQSKYPLYACKICIKSINMNGNNQFTSPYIGKYIEWFEKCDKNIIILPGDHNQKSIGCIQFSDSRGVYFNTCEKIESYLKHGKYIVEFEFNAKYWWRNFSRNIVVSIDYVDESLSAKPKISILSS